MGHSAFMRFFDAEGVQMIVHPAHTVLDGYMQVPEGIPGGDLDSSPDKRTDLSKRNFELINNVLVFHKTRQLMYPVVGEMTHPPWIERNMPVMFKNIHPVDNPESQGLHFVRPIGNLPDVPHKIAAKDSWYLWMASTYGLT